MSKNKYNNIKNVSFDDNIIKHHIEENKDDNFLSMIRDRYDDIHSRGGDCKVHDYDGKVVILRNAKIWYNYNGDYVEPRDYDSCDFCNSIINFFR